MRKLIFTFASALLALGSNAQSLARVNNAPNLGNKTLKTFYNEEASGLQRENLVPTAFTQANGTTLRSIKRSSTDGLPFITEQPEGVLYKNLYRFSHNYYYYWGFICEAKKDGALSQYVIADNGDVYIKDVISSISGNSWIKGTRGEGDTINVTLPQTYYSENELDTDGNPTDKIDYYYAWRMKMGEIDNNGSKSQTLLPDEDTQTIKYVLRNDSLILVDNEDKGIYIGLGNADGQWTGYAELSTMLTKETAETVTPSANATVDTYSINYNANGYDDVKIIKVAIDGDNIYLGNIDDSMPDAWAKGKIEGGKAVFEPSYLGIDTIFGYHTYFFPADYKLQKRTYNSTDSLWFENTLVFDYDANAKTLKADRTILVNGGRNIVKAAYNYNKPLVKAWKNEAKAPALPQFISYTDYIDQIGEGSYDIKLPVNAADGTILDPKKLYYNIYYDDELFTYTPDEYVMLTEDMTDVPYNFVDRWDFFKFGDTRTLFFHHTGFDTIGVDAFYKDGDTECHSGRVTYNVNTHTTGIDSKLTDAEQKVAAVTYTDLSGRSVAHPKHGVYLKTIKYADGTIKTKKMICK